jgi:protocatechuate 3,4-dioxygenase beta subunit
VGQDETPRRITRWTAVVAAAVVVAFLWSAWPRSVDRSTPRRATQTAPDIDAAPPTKLAPHRTVAAPTESASTTPSVAESTSTRLRITVVDAVAGAPIEGASVRVVGSEYERPATETVDATTGADGTADVPVARHDELRVVARKRGFRVVKQDVWRGGDSDVRIELVAGVPVQGRVVYADSREPAAGVDVRAWVEDMSFDHVADEVDVEQTTDRDGRFELAGLPPSKWVRVFARRAGWGYAAATLQRSGPGPEIELVLGEGGIVDGVVYDEAGRPLGDVEVFLLWSYEDLPPTLSGPAAERNVEYATRLYVNEFVRPPVRTDASGRFEFRGVKPTGSDAPRRYAAVARDARGRQARSESVEFSHHGERETRDLKFAAPPSLTVRLVSSKPIDESVVVRVEHEHREIAKQELAPYTTTARFVSLPLCRWDVYAEGPDASWSLREQVGVPRGGEVEVSFDLSDGGTIAGVVVDDTGAPVEGASIRFTDMNGGISAVMQTKSAGDGAFALRHVPSAPGRMAVSDERRDLLACEVDDVVPGGAPLRVVLSRRGRVTWRVDAPTKLRTTSIRALYEGRAAGGSESIGDDAGGVFSTSPDFIGGPMLAWVVAEGYAPTFIDALTLPPGGSLDLGTVHLVAGTSFDGRLVDADGAAVIRSELRAEEDWCEWSVELNAEGRFHLDHLPARPLHLVASAPRGRREAFPDWMIVVEPGAKSGTFQIGPAGAVVGRVRDAKGAPVKESDVHLSPARDDASRQNRWERTDADGAFSIKLQPGRWRARVRDTRAGADSVEFDVVAGDNPPLELRVK